MFRAPAYVGTLVGGEAGLMAPGDGCHHCHDYGSCHWLWRCCYFANHQPAAYEIAESEVQTKPHRASALLGTLVPGCWDGMVLFWVHFVTLAKLPWHLGEQRPKRGWHWNHGCTFNKSTIRDTVSTGGMSTGSLNRDSVLVSLIFIWRGYKALWYDIPMTFKALWCHCPATFWLILM